MKLIDRCKLEGVNFPKLNRIGNPNKHYLNGLRTMRDEIANLEVPEPMERLDEGKILKFFCNSCLHPEACGFCHEKKDLVPSICQKFGTFKIDEGKIFNVLNSPNFDVVLGHNEKLMKELATAIEQSLEG